MEEARYSDFRLELVEQLFGLYRGRKHAGRHCSREMDWLNPQLSHLPLAVAPHDCVVCSTKGHEKHRQGPSTDMRLTLCAATVMWPCASIKIEIVSKTITLLFTIGYIE